MGAVRPGPSATGAHGEPAAFHGRSHQREPLLNDASAREGAPRGASSTVIGWPGSSATTTTQQQAQGGDGPQTGAARSVAAPDVVALEAHAVGRRFVGQHARRPLDVAADKSRRRASRGAGLPAPLSQNRTRGSHIRLFGNVVVAQTKPGSTTTALLPQLMKTPNQIVPSSLTMPGPPFIASQQCSFDSPEDKSIGDRKSGPARNSLLSTPLRTRACG